MVCHDNVGQKSMPDSNFPDTLLDSLVNPQERGCPAGERLMVDSNGDVYPCQLMGHPDYCLGNIRNESLDEMRNSPKLNQVCQQIARRVENIAKCQTCQWRGFCRVACPAVVLWQKGTIWDTDELCRVRADLYSKLIFRHAEGFMELHENMAGFSFNSIKARAVFSDIYRFFDITIAMKSDEKELLGWLRQFYSRFRIEKAKQKVDAIFYMMAKKPEGPLVIAEEDSLLKIKSLDDIDSVPPYAYLLAFNYIAANLKSHFLLHSAVVSRNNEGLAIIGPSGSGKTVLTLQMLLRKGFSFLSDDQLAINRRTHLIDPFLRSIGIRENTLTLFDNLELEHLEPQVIVGGQRKWFVDISEISGNEVGKPCRLKYLVFLVNSLNETEVEQRIVLVVDDVNDELLGKVRSLTKSGEIHCKRMKNCFALSFYPRAEAPSALDLERLCRDCGVWILDVRKLSDVKPDFHSTPKLQRIPWREATMELLKELQNDFRSTPGQAFLELAELLEDAECYKLCVGKLDEMADQVCDLILDSEHGTTAR